MPDTILAPKELTRGGYGGTSPKRWRADARIFVREVIKDQPDGWQDEFLAAISGIQLPGRQPPKNMLALKACKGPGKSRCLAWAIWWWLFTRWHANVAVMSITEDNLRQNLWRELALVQGQSWALQQTFNFSGEQITAKKFSATWFAKARSFPQNADKSQQDNTIAGLHGRHPAVFCDEVGDYPDGVVVAAEAIFSSLVDGHPPEGLLALAGNPTSTSGPLFRVCTRDRGRWWVMEITGDPKDPNRATRIDPVWAQAQIDQFGADNPWVLVNVFGKFPHQQADKLLGPEEVEAAAGREPHGSYLQDPLILGLDVARYGDNESVLTKRRGNMVWRQRVWRETDLMSLADQVATECSTCQPAAFFADQGGPGAGVIDRLRQLQVPVIGVDFGGGAIEGKFADRRSEMWWRMADWVKHGGCIPNDATLKAELVTPIFEYKSTGKITKFRMESKADMRKRGVGSPDRADSLCTTFAVKVIVAPDQMQISDPRYAPRLNKIRGGTDDDWDPLGDN